MPEVLLTADQAAGEQARVAGGCAGLRRGHRLVLAVPGCPRLVTAVMGALRVGIVPVVLDPATPPTELHALIDDADPALVIDSMAALDELHAHAPGELAPVPLGRPMHVTSGTTGRRKGVTSGVLEPPAAAALWAEETQLWGFVGSDVHLVVSPLYHSAPLRFAIGTLLAGGTIVVPGRFNPAEFGDLAQRYRPTTMFTAPAQLQRLRELADPRATAALRSFRLIAHAGAPCPEPVKRWLLDVVAPEAVWEFYGCTEGQFTACSAADWLAHPGTVGRARPGRTLSTDPDGTIWCTVPAHARFSYWRAPEKTAAAWRDTPQGPAFTVGDLGRLDAEGWLYLDGRREDLVITGGVNVYPVEVERVLEQCPGVQEVAVFGVDDDRWGQRVEAAVVGSSATAVHEWARRHLVAAQRPKVVHTVDALPRTSTGKVLRSVLRQRRGPDC